MIASSSPNYEEPAGAGSAFRLTMIDFRRALDAAPENEREALFAAGAVETVVAWSGRILKPDLVDALYHVGVAVGINDIELQVVLAGAFDPRSAGAP